MAENQKVDLSTLPKGLTKEEFTALPNFKKIRAFFTWAGVVSIVSGIFVLSSIGHLSQSILQNGGSIDGLFQMGAVKLNLLFMVVSIVLGILLIKKKTTTMAYILAIIELIYVLLAITSGGSVGIGAISFLLSLDKVSIFYRSGSIKNGNFIRKSRLETIREILLETAQTEERRIMHMRNIIHPRLPITKLTGRRSRKRIMVLFQPAHRKV